MGDIRIEPITSKADVPRCVQLCCDAVADDKFAHWMDRYSSPSFYDETTTRITDAINPDNTTDFAFKAVVDVSDDNGSTHEEIVGVSHWYYGFVKIAKVDPFGKKVYEQPDEIAPDEVASGDTATPPDVGNLPKVQCKDAAAAMAELLRQHGNTYVSTIRGKKHIYLRRMMVDPKHQRKGIGRKLLQWGVEKADTEQIVGYLNARPAAMKMYSAAGFKPVGYLNTPTVEGDDDLDVPPGIAMLRLPRPREAIPT